MNVYQKIDILTGLTMLKDLAEKHPNKLKHTYGICRHLNLLCSDGMGLYEYELVNYFSEGWEHHSGDEQYPIQEDKDYGKWQGENLILRISLINYLIDRVSNHSTSTYNTLELRGQYENFNIYR